MPSIISFDLRKGAARPASRDAQLALVITLVLVGLAGTGCAALSSSNSFSESSGSVSDSLGSSSDSSGSSSGGDDSAYRSEVTQYVVIAVEQDVAPEDLRRGVTEIALAHGISDWEATSATLDAVDAGLEGVSQADRTRYRDAFATPAVSAPGAGGDAAR